MISLTLSPVFSTQGICQVSSGFPHLEPLPDITLKTVTSNNHRIHTFFFLSSLKNHCSLVPIVHCIKNLCHILYLVFWVLFLGRMANLLPVTPFRSEQFICYFLFITLCTGNSPVCLYTSSNVLPIPEDNITGNLKYAKESRTFSVII